MKPVQARCRAFKDIAAIADIFLDYYQAWTVGALSHEPEPLRYKKYERREIAKQLAGLLNEVSARSL